MVSLHTKEVLTIDALINTAAYISIGIVAIIIIAAVLLILASFCHVKQGFVAITEKLSRYHRTLTKGVYWLNPFAERVVVRYPITVQEVSAVFTDFTVRLQFRIEDVKKYHYQDVLFTNFLSGELEGAKREELVSLIQTAAPIYGVAIVAVKIV